MCGFADFRRRVHAPGLAERQQIGVDLVLVDRAHPVREPGIDLEVAPFTSFEDSIAEAPIGTI